MEEGCLSLPGIHESVKRGNRIHVTYMDEDMVEHDEVVEGYLARVMQHEFDHLEGKMFIDHLSPLRKQMIKGKLNAMLKGKAHCTYKVKTVKYANLIIWYKRLKKYKKSSANPAR